MTTSETGWPSERGMVNTAGLTRALGAPFTGDAGGASASVANHDGEKSPKRSPDTPGDAPPPVLSTSDAVKRNTDWLFAVLVKHMVLEQSPVEVLSSASRASWCVGSFRKRISPFPAPKRHEANDDIARVPCFGASKKFRRVLSRRKGKSLSSEAEVEQKK